MISEVGVAIFLTLAFVAGFVACTSRFTERLLWGSALCSVCLGLSVQFGFGGYYGLTMVSAFLVSDVVIYLYFRTQNLLPATPQKNARTDRLYRIFFLWLALCCVAGAGTALFAGEPELPLKTDGPGLALLHERIWGPDWVLVAIPVLSLLILVVGGFFLVRKER